MLKFLYIGDMHEMEHTPSSRIDHFQETVHEKRQEILALAKKHQVSAILEGGDFLDKPRVSNDFLSYLLTEWGMDQRLIQKLLFQIQLGTSTIEDLKTQMEQQIPILGIAGNHELIGGAIESYEKTSLSVLEEFGLIHMVSKDHPIIFSDDEISVAISGSSYHFQIDGTNKDSYIVENKVADYQIHLVHGMLLNKPETKIMKSTYVPDIAFQTKADLTISGHDHTGYPLHEIDGKQFVNPGAPVRLTAAKKEIARMPKVLLITVSKEHGVQVESIFLTCAKKGEEVLSRKHIEDGEKRFASRLSMEEIVHMAHIDKARSLEKIVEKMGKTDAIDHTVVSDCIERIREMQLAIEPESNSTPDYFIESLELENFLSHKHSVFDLSQGINILTGKSRAGKSAVLRALRELQECYLPNPRKAIFKNEEYFRITARLSNGYMISRYVENKSKGRSLNGYSVYDPNTGKTDFYNTKSLPEIQKLFKFQPLQITQKKAVNTNFMMQGDGWFFTESLSSGDRAKLVGYPYGAHIADAVAKEINQESKEEQRNVKTTELQIAEKDLALKQYAFLPKLQHQLETAMQYMERYEELQKKIQQIETLMTQKIELETYLKQAEQILKQLETDREKRELLLTKLKERQQKFIQAETLVEQARHCHEIARQLSEISNKLACVSQARELFTTYQSKAIEYTERIQNGTKLLQEKQRLEELIPTMERLQRSFLPVDLSLLSQLKEQKLKAETVEKLMTEIRVIQKDGVLLKKQWQQQEKQVEEKRKELAQRLKDAGTCPICHSVLSNAMIESILKK